MEQEIGIRSMDGLPPEIITDIVSRLEEFKHIGQCRCVSKLWHSILTDSTLTTNLTKTTSDFLLHFKPHESFSEPRMYHLEDGRTLNKRQLHPVTVLDKSYYPGVPVQPTRCSVVGSCNGFVCFLSPTVLIERSFHIFYTDFIYVINPVTQEYANLPPFTNCLHYKSLSGFGFDHSNKVFKVVLLLFTYDYTTDVLDNEVQVHTLGSTNWRNKRGIAPNDLGLSIERHSSTLVNGSLHWITVDNSLMTNGPCIVSFNLGVEEFGRVPTPSLLQFSYKSYQLGLLEDQLSLVEREDDDFIFCINVWVMKKYNMKESWVKQFSISREVPLNATPKLIKFRKNGELLLLLDDEELIGYNTVNQMSRHLQLGWAGKRNPCFLEVHSVMCSLLSLKEALGVDCEIKKTTSLKRKR